MKVTACELRGADSESPTSTRPGGARAVLTKVPGEPGATPRYCSNPVLRTEESEERRRKLFEAGSARHEKSNDGEPIWQLPFHPCARALRTSPGEAFQGFMRGRGRNAR